MNRLRRLLPIVGLAGVLAAAGAAASVSSAFAYGSADQPLAQVSVSANCDNPSFPLCANVVGTGGIWYWVEVDAGGTGDMTGAACGHTVGGVGGPGGAGAGSIKGTATWRYTTLETAPPGAIFFGAFDPHDSYYAITLTIGETWLIPTTTGHYATKLTNGVQVQINVAP
ncbi:MAG TPA: hypothetical protein VFR33_14785 [Candidatus Dormibacteraeota bacterium]|nr:hypothetical protein [Candidatus Dormibacteraeota bacterium]